MQLTITEKKENQFLKRFEVKGKIKFDNATPSNSQIAELLAKELGKTPELVIMKGLSSNFGSQEAEIIANVYDNVENKNKAEVLLPHQKKKTAGENKEENK